MRSGRPQVTGNLTSNYNDLFVTAGGGLFKIGKIGSLSQGTGTELTLLSDWTTATGRDTPNSIPGDPKFISATNLHINTAIATPVESAGTPIAGITTDIDGDTRNVTTPDIGADEGTFIAPVTNDMQATAFIDPTNGGGKVAGASFSPQASFTNNGTATQTSVTVRYRILDAMSMEVYNNTQVIASIASGVTTPVTFASTSLSAGTYTIKAKAELGTDTVPANDEITGTITAENPLSGPYTVGAMGTYTTLTQAINKLNAFGVSGPVTLTLLDASNTTVPQNTGEVFPIVINAIAGASSTNTVTIKPATGVTSAITGSAASGALIKLNGASFVIIDGSNTVGGTSRDLTIENTSATTPSVLLIGSVGATPITGVTIKNCVVRNGVNTSSAVVLSDAATLGNAGLFSNITIQNNSVQKAFIGVYATGGTIPQGGSNLIYTGNDLSTSSANAIRNVGLYMQGVNGATVSNNTIGNFDVASAENDVGIWLATGTINATVSGNTVSNLSCTNTSGAPIGINVTPAVTGNANITISQNSVSNLATLGSSQIFGIVAGSTSGDAITVDRNNVQNIQNNGTGTFGAHGIFVNGGNNHVVKNNFVSNLNHNMTGGAAFSTTFGVFGINIQSGTGHKVYNNSVNLYGLMPGTSTTSLLSAAFALGRHGFDKTAISATTSSPTTSRAARPPSPTSPCISHPAGRRP